MTGFTRIDGALIEQATLVLDEYRNRGLTLVTAESCTGGLVASVLTDPAGASKVVDGGFVTYSNHAKNSALRVPQDMLARFGAVSEEVARAMAEGALQVSPADISVAITGIAGPDGGSAEKPVGLVHFASARRGHPTLHRERRFGDIGRYEVRRASVLEALDLLMEIASSER